MKYRIAALFVSLLCVNPAQTEDAHELTPVADVDPVRYQGQWYEIALIPHWVERGCSDTITTYLPRTDGRIDIVNECMKKGKTRRAKMVAWHVGPGSDGKYKVRYLWPFSGYYWVLALNPEYQWAVVGSPSRRYLWILSRTPALPAETYAELMQFAALKGYDTSLIESTSQNGTPSHTQPTSAR